MHISKQLGSFTAGPTYSSDPAANLVDTTCRIERRNQKIRATLIERLNGCKDRKAQGTANTLEEAMGKLMASAKRLGFDSGCSLEAATRAFLAARLNEREPLVAMQGALHRDRNGEWKWDDGTPEPRVSDLKLAMYDPSYCWIDREGELHILIPSNWEQEIDRLDPGVVSVIVRLSDLPSAKKEKEGTYVPKDLWDTAMDMVVGCQWSDQDYADLIRRSTQGRAGIVVDRCIAY